MSTRAAHVLLMNLSDPGYASLLTTEYLAFGYLAAALRAAGIAVTWLDEHTDGPYDPSTFDFKARGPVDVVGCSPSFATYRRALGWLSEWKRRSPGVVTVMGGQHAMMAAEEILAESQAVDAVCLGEGERAIESLVGAVSRGERVGGLPGFATRVDGAPFRGELLPPPPLDDLPFPARDTLERWIAQRRVTQVALQNSRGCAYGCHFCHLPRARKAAQGYDGRFRSPEGVVREMAALQDRFGVREMFFCSPQFGGQGDAGRAWMRRFADAVLASGRDLRFEIECRSDTLHDADLVGHLARAGLIRVFIGLESGSDAALQRFGKGISAARHREVAALLRRSGVSISGSGLIMLHPLASLEDLRDNAELLYDLGECHTSSLWSYFRAFPGIHDGERLGRRGLLPGPRRHDDVLSYHFADGRVGALRQSMAIALDARGLSRAERVVHLVDIQIGLEEANLPAVAPGVAPSDLRALLDMRERGVPLRNAVLAALFDHFLQALRLADRGGTAEAWSGLAARLERNLSVLEPRVRDFLEKHDKHLARTLAGRAPDVRTATGREIAQ